MRYGYLWILIIVALLLGMVMWFMGGSRIIDIAPYYLKRIIGETAVVKINNVEYKVEIASTSAARAKGLTGRDHLELDKGMLFVFTESGVYPFTMINTAITLDIIWILDDQVVYLYEKALPGEERIVPDTPANYVLELRANSINNRNFKIGDLVEITFDKDK